MPLSFPTSGLTPNVTTYTFASRTWLWTGTVWQSVGSATGSQGVQGVQGVQGSYASDPTVTGLLYGGM
jgi:hypothetical protein